jgi:transcriptional regulator with XRE-family HTH domain
MDDDRPMWARRLRAEREARGWSQLDAVRALRAHGGCAGDESLLRQWKRWEAGEVEPGSFYAPRIARAFGVVASALFPLGRGEQDVELLAAAGMTALELVARLGASDVSASTLGALAIMAERLCCEYSHQPPAELHAEGLDWLRRLTALLDRRLTLTQHREVLALAGRIALLVGCLEADMGQRRAAETTRQAASSLGKEAGDADTVAWAHEMRAWFSLTQGQFRAAIAAADAGLAAAGPTLSVSVQLNAHKAKASARLGDRRGTLAALDEGQAILGRLPYPENLGNHFTVDPDKWPACTTDCYRVIGLDDQAEATAREVIRAGTDPTGVIIRPMRVAEARITLGVVAARRDGDLDLALDLGRQALGGARRSLPSLAMHSGELVAVLRARYPAEPAVREYAAEVRTLTA